MWDLLRGMVDHDSDTQRSADAALARSPGLVAALTTRTPNVADDIEIYKAFGTLSSPKVVRSLIKLR